MPRSLRTKIMTAIVGSVLVTVLLAIWAVNDRIEAGARREADSQALAQTAQVRALYQERAATLAAEGEVISLYPAVIAAIADSNAQPLLRWSGQVAERQRTSVTVVDADGRVVARGHEPEQRGDLLAPRLVGLQLALRGEFVSGTESGDELGLALRGYAPVLRDGAIVGAVMIADPLDQRLLHRLGGDAGGGTAVDIQAAVAGTDGCEQRGDGAAATCRFRVLSPSLQPAATVSVAVPLVEVQEARGDARRALWWIGGAALFIGALGAWLLARSLTRPLSRLTLWAERIGRAQHAPPEDISRADEIGVLARSLEAMRAQVAGAAAALRDERDVLNAVLDASDEGIVLTDATGTTRLANARWTALTGGDGIVAAGPLVRSGGGSATFGDATRGWLASPAGAVPASGPRSA